MFTTESGKPFSPRFYYKKFKEYSRLAGLPEVKLHACRHFAIYYLINVAHIPPSIVQQIVGHASPMLTLSVYTHSTTEQQNEAMEKMGDVFQ